MNYSDDFKQERELMYKRTDDFHSMIMKLRDAHFDCLHRGKAPERGVIRDEILESWQKSLSAGLDPSHIRNLYVTDKELEQKLKNNKDLIDVADVIINEFTTQLSMDQFSIDLYDPELCMLKRYGHYKDVPNRIVKPGYVRSEDICGATSLSEALNTGKAAQLIGGEHFSDDLLDFVCTAAVVFFKGQIIGFINVIENLWKTNSRTIGTLITIARLIEKNLEQNLMKQEIAAKAAINEEMINANQDAILLVSPDGMIVNSNNSAIRLLGLMKSQINGFHISSVLGDNNEINNALKSDIKSTVSNELLTNINGYPKRFYATVTPIFTDNTITNYLVALKDQKSIKKVINTVGGWKAKATFNDIIGTSQTFAQTVRFARETAKLGSNTLIEGESGTGKDLFAQAIHNESSNALGPFVSVNCGSIPANLLESELFGYEGGSFTGSKKNGQMGKFELADGGTIFLDEINSMPLDMQVKLLRAIQEKTICRVGGNSSINLNLNIIAASNENLWELVEKGLFRADLYYRLNVIKIHIPPLREHTEDIPFISKEIINRLVNNRNDIILSPEVLMSFREYSWPGNVRELENVLERAIISIKLRNSNIIQSCDLDEKIFGTNSGSIMQEPESPKESYASMEKTLILEELYKNKWNITKTAKALNMARNTLYQRMKKYDLYN